MKQKTIFYEGQQVGCLMYGEGTVHFTCDDLSLTVIFKDDYQRSFNFDGRYQSISRPTLYPIEQYRDIIKNNPLPEPEEWKPKQGDLCWFWDYNVEGARVGYFKEMNEGYFVCKDAGDYGFCAPYIAGELPPNMKEVQP